MATNPFDVTDDILEGFICPICREDLKSVDALMCHFERKHAADSEDGGTDDAVKSIFREILTKAKRKIRINFDEVSGAGAIIPTNEPMTTNSYVDGYSAMNPFNPSCTEKQRQLVGVTRSYFEQFRIVRDPRIERYASETNKLIIRLHRLLKDMPTDPVMRKQHEQKTVIWLDGSSVKLCPSCAKSFHLTRRQHHCRLCGCIMCNDCSHFLALNVALNLVSLAEIHIYDAYKQAQQDHDENAASHSQLEQNNDGIRTCSHCLWLLETRQQMHESRTCRPIITRIYGEIQQLSSGVEPNIEMYLRIIRSLHEGESIFTIADASALRARIGECAEAIDMRSKQVLVISAEPGSRAAALNKVIRLYCIQLIKEKMLSIPPLPNEEKIRQVQTHKRMETEQRMQTQRRKALEAYERYGLSNTSLDSKDVNQQQQQQRCTQSADLQSLENWSAHQVSTADVKPHDDPLVEQINIIKGYIKQARQDMNFDVVETLEMNLRELQHEFYECSQKKIMTSTKEQNPTTAIVTNTTN